MGEGSDMHNSIKVMIPDPHQMHKANAFTDKIFVNSRTCQLRIGKHEFQDIALQVVKCSVDTRNDCRKFALSTQLRVREHSLQTFLDLSLYDFTL